MVSIYRVNLDDNVFLRREGRSTTAEAKNDRISSFVVTKPDANEDTFTRTTAPESKAEVFVASDGKKYNLDDYMNIKLSAANYYFYNYIESNDEAKDYMNIFKSAFGIKSDETKVQELLETAQGLLSSGQPLAENFETLTGKPYNRRNVELFLRGQIKLIAEVAVEDFISNKIEKVTPAPVFGKDVLNKNIQSKKINLNKNDNKKYQTLLKSLNNDYNKKLEKVLESGILLLNDSDSGSSVLDNLHSMLTKDRVAGIDNIKLVQEAIDILSKPYVITQSPADVPEKYQSALTEIIMKEQEMDEETAKEFLNSEHSGSCAAAAFEYELATEHTAEFFRIVEGITSKEYKSDKNVNYTSISADKESAVENLKKNNTEYKEKDENTVTVAIRPDKNAIIRARIQNYYHDAGERSMIDVLVQSAIMNLGSRGTYDDLSGTRKRNEVYPGNGGLGPDEVIYAQSILTDGKSKVNVYQNVNSAEWKLDGRNTTLEETKNQILQMLSEGKNVVIGMSIADEENNIMGGHETVIVGYSKNLNGDGVFILQDSDDNTEEPMVVDENMLLSKIQHTIVKN